jgi:hypothetical protein
MYGVLQFGCFLVAFSPSIALFVQVVSKRPILISIAVASAGSWLSSFMITSIVWIGFGNAPVEVVALSGVILQELHRALVVSSYRYVELMIVNGIDDFSSGIAAGVGFGSMHSVVVYGSLLFESISEGTYYNQGACPELPVILVGAYYSLSFFVLDVVLMQVAFKAWNQQSYSLASLILSVHLIATMSTFGKCTESLLDLPALCLSVWVYWFRNQK